MGAVTFSSHTNWRKCVRSVFLTKCRTGYNCCRHNFPTLFCLITDYFTERFTVFFTAQICSPLSRYRTLNGGDAVQQKQISRWIFRPKFALFAQPEDLALAAKSRKSFSKLISSFSLTGSSTEHFRPAPGIQDEDKLEIY